MAIVRINFPEFKNLASDLVRKGDPLAIANQAREVIRRRTKNGMGVYGGQLKRLPKLTTFTVQSRREYARGGRTGEFFSPGRSNLTLTGQLLNSMRTKERGSKAAIIEISNEKRSDGLTNRQVNISLERRGFRFFGLSEGEVRILIDSYRKVIESRIGRA